MLGKFCGMKIFCGAMPLVHIISPKLSMALWRHWQIGVDSLLLCKCLSLAQYVTTALLRW